METTNILPISEARKQIFKITKKVQDPAVFYTLTKKGKPKAVIMSNEEFESWQETLCVMRDFSDIKKDAEKAEKEYKKGNYLTFENILLKEGFVLKEKKKK